MRTETWRKKPVVVEAVQLHEGNAAEIADWCGGAVHYLATGLPSVVIDTLEGQMTATPGDYVIQGVAGEFYPVKPDIFRRSYDKES